MGVDQRQAGVGSDRVDEARPAPSLREQHKALRESAERAVQTARGIQDKAAESLTAAKESLRQALIDAEDLGIDRKRLAQLAGISESAIGQRVRTPAPKKTDA